MALEATEALNVAVFENPGLSERRIKTLNATLTEFRRNAGDFG